MISTEALRTEVDGGRARVLVDLVGGLAVDREALGPGPAILVVGPVIDATKVVVRHRLVGAIDRAELAMVKAIALDDEVVRRLPTGDLAPEELIGVVESLGLSWRLVDDT